MRKLAVVSHILPPSPSGQAVMLHRLLRAVPTEAYCLISREDYSNSNNDSLRLPAPYYFLPPEFQLQRPNRSNLYRFKELTNVAWQVIARARRIVKICRQERCRSVLACSGDLADIPAGYLASRRLRIPFYVYLFDDWRFQWTRRLHQWFVTKVEPMVMRRATKVIVPNEFLQKTYERRYGIKPAVIHNPLEMAQSQSQNGFRPKADQEIRIVYTGAVYHVNYDCFRNLMAAVAQLNRPRLKLHLYMAQDPGVLEFENIRGPIVLHEHVPPEEAHRIQREADILFLPLSFNPEFADIINTSAPGKMGEYMASGRPILAHAPAGSFVSWYFRDHECGALIDSSDVPALASSIERLLDDESYTRKLVEKAYACAARDFNLTIEQDKFRSLLFEGVA